MTVLITEQTDRNRRATEHLRSLSKGTSFSAGELVKQLVEMSDATRVRLVELESQIQTADENLRELRRLRGALRTVATGSTARPRSPAERPGQTKNDEVHALHAAYAGTRDPALRARLVEAYDGFACSMARRFSTRRESYEDLAQVARLGLLLALDRFDPGRGRPFKSFASATITGELKRHVRDRTWAVHVTRTAQDHFLVAVRAIDDLTQTLGRSPKTAEVAAHTRLTEEEVLKAMEVAQRQRPSSLDAPGTAPDRPAFQPATTETGFEDVEGKQMVSWLMERLLPREREVIRLRFVDELTQSEIANRIGCTQMSVSRTLTRTLARMRALALSAP